MQHNYAMTRTCLFICMFCLLAFGLLMMYSTTAPIHGHSMLIKQSVFIVWFVSRLFVFDSIIVLFVHALGACRRGFDDSPTYDNIHSQSLCFSWYS